MNPPTVVVPGIVKADGTLVLSRTIPLPAGMVRVTVQPLVDLPEGDPFFDMLRGIWAAQDARGHVPRRAEQVEAERLQTRRDWDERMRRLERVQAETQPSDE